MNNIRAARVTAGLTQEQAAKLASVSLEAWQRIEAGRKTNKKAVELFMIKVTRL